MRLDRIEWPNNARVAVVLSFALELWEGGSVETGYHDGAPIEIAPELLSQGYRDPGAASWQDYGPRRGMPRLIEIANRNKVPVTAVVSGLAAHRWPDLMKEIHAGGHELCAHSYAQEVRAWKLDRAGEQDNIRLCSEAIEAATGVAPVGWISPSAQPSIHTPDLLKEQGYQWHGDYLDDDNPYFVETTSGPLVAIPYQLDLNDIKVYIGGKHHASVYADWFKSKFDAIYRESAKSGGMVMATAHAAVYGRPFGAWAVEECIQYAQKYDDVWFTSRKGIAEWMVQRYG